MAKKRYKDSDFKKEPKKRYTDADFAEPEAKTGALKALGLGAAQGVSFGFADEIAAGSKAILRQIMAEQPEDIAQAYQEELAKVRPAFDKAAEDQPVAFQGADIAGAIGTAFIPGIGIAKGASALNIIGKSAAFGATRALGETDKLLSKEALEEAVSGGLLGAGAGAVAVGLGKVLTKLGVAGRKPLSKSDTMALITNKKAAFALDDALELGNKKFINVLQAEDLIRPTTKAMGVRQPSLGKPGLWEKMSGWWQDNLLNRKTVDSSQLEIDVQGAVKRITRSITSTLDEAAVALQNKGKKHLFTAKDIGIGDVINELDYHKGIMLKSGNITNPVYAALDDVSNQLMRKPAGLGGVRLVKQQLGKLARFNKSGAFLSDEKGKLFRKAFHKVKGFLEKKVDEALPRSKGAFKVLNEKDHVLLSYLDYVVDMGQKSRLDTSKLRAAGGDIPQKFIGGASEELTGAGLSKKKLLQTLGLAVISPFRAGAIGAGKALQSTAPQVGSLIGGKGAEGFMYKIFPSYKNGKVSTPIDKQLAKHYAQQIKNPRERAKAIQRINTTGLIEGVPIPDNVLESARGDDPTTTDLLQGGGPQ